MVLQQRNIAQVPFREAEFTALLEIAEMQLVRS
jgi:hypothetical protein